MRKWLWLGMVLGAACVAGYVARWTKERASDRRVYLDVSGGARPVRGTLTLSTFGEEAMTNSPQRHAAEFVNGRFYDGMEDNDLRGFLDGGYKYGWNQPTQVHVRVGRRARRPTHGELEIFRVVQRWDKIYFVPETRILSAKLVLGIEDGPPFPVDLCLYEVKKDWDPGQGGVDGDNTSPPKLGEVWWRDVSHGERPWGLPGVGFASDEHRDADTGAMPLAVIHYEPGARELVLTSDRLTQYVDVRMREIDPLLFLLKLADDHEDSPGSVMTIYSGSKGDDRNVSRRPRLKIEWESAAEVTGESREIVLEHGREELLHLEKPNVAHWAAVSFVGESGFERPTLLMRSAGATEWRRVGNVFDLANSGAEVKVSANVDPISLGDAFEASLRDTWVMTAPPLEQEVVWTFLSPTGERITRQAAYQGDSRWSIRFEPPMLGRWRYWWSQTFTENRYQSAIGLFDVVGGDVANVTGELNALRQRIQDSPLSTHLDRVWKFGVEFAKLERAALQRLTSESFRSQASEEIRNVIHGVREAFVGHKLSGEYTPTAMKRDW